VVEFAKRQPLSALAASLVAFTLAFTLLSGDAFARHVRCGERVMHDVRLDSDLNDCPGVGLIAGATGITIDLDGHTIDGTGRGTGIVNGYGGNGRRDVTIEDGAVRGFKVGVRSSGRGTVLRHLTVTRNATGGVILRGSRCTVERSTVADNGYGHGISVTAADDCRLDRNRVSRHLGAGIATSRSSGIRIEDNRVYANRRAGILLSTTTDSVVERNSVLDNDVGISLFDRSDGNVVRRNSAAANITGIALTFGGARNRIESNSVSGSESAGVRLAETRADNVVLRNLVTLSGEEGIRVIDSAGARLEANTAYDNSGDGLYVDAQDTGPATLRRNTANHNGDDGIDADSALVVIGANVTERNSDLGIEAVAGVTDAGANGARWNGNAAECAGIACS
jgi:parallel beta-helix repeat protein